MFTPKKFLSKYGLILILIFFVLTVIPGIFYNYPLATTVGDEPVLMSAALKMISDRTLRPAYPTNYYLPMALYVYLPFYLFVLIILRLFIFASNADLINFGITDFGKLLPVGRVISTLLAAASIYLIYRISIKLFKSRNNALFSAFFLSASLLFIQQAHFARVWSPQIFFILLAFLYIVIFYTEDKLRAKRYIQCAALSGLAFATHIVGIFIFLTFAVAHYFKNQENNFFRIFLLDRKFLLAVSTLFLIIPLTYYLNPYGITNYLGYSADAIVKVSPSGEEISLESTGALYGSIYYLKILFEYEFFLLAIFLISLPIIFLKEKRKFAIIFSFITIYYLLIASGLGASYAEPRYILPIIPFMAIIAAYGANFLVEKYGNYKKTVYVFTVLVILSMLYMPLKFSYLLTRPSTRLMAQEYIYENIETGKSIVNFDNYLEINESKESISDIKNYNEYFFTKKREFLIESADDNYPEPNYYVLIPKTYSEIPAVVLARDYDYLILPWWNKNEREQELGSIYKLGFELGDLLKRFPDGAPDDTERMDIANNMRRPFYFLRTLDTTGPVIDLYRLKPL